VLELILGLGVAAVGGAVAAAGVVRGRRRRAWTAAMQGAAGVLGGRVSTGGALPELRLELDGRTLTVLPGLRQGGPGARAEVALAPALSGVRLMVAWGSAEEPPGLEHVPLLSGAHAPGLDGPLRVRADDAPLARRWLDAGRLDLLDVGRELGGGAGLEVVVRGGHLALAVRTFDPTAALVERLARAARSAASSLEAAAAGPAALAAPALAAARRECALCGDASRPGEPWVACARCAAPYHADCFRQATACVVEGCDGARAAPLGELAG
jgi:hypothetical protein